MEQNVLRLHAMAIALIPFAFVIVLIAKAAASERPALGRDANGFCSVGAGVAIAQAPTRLYAAAASSASTPSDP
jgi:hypothetical protein